MYEFSFIGKKGDYISKWGLTDIYPEAEEELRAALASEEDFDTGWTGCQKEIRYCRIRREEGVIIVDVSVHSDDLWESDDLIYDALWTAARREDELPDDIIDSIREAAVYGCDDHFDSTDELPTDTDYESLVALLDEAENDLCTLEDRSYNILVEIVKAHLDYMDEMKAGDE